MNVGKYWPSLEEEQPYIGPFSTYPEIHAAMFGLGVGGLAIAATLTPLVPLEIFILVYIRVGHYAVTGKRLKTQQGTALDVPLWLLGQINDEPHYYLVPSTLLMFIAVALSFI